MAAVFVAEIGDVTRFATASRLCSWAGLTPRHRESDTHVQRGNVRGAITVLRRSSAGLAHDDKPAPYAVDVAGLVEYAEVLINDLEAGAEITPKRLQPRLVVDRPR